MKIQPEALEKVRTATINGEKLSQLFEQLAAETETAGAGNSSVTIDYQHSDQEVDSETWIPQIILVLRPAEAP